MIELLLAPAPRSDGPCLTAWLPEDREALRTMRPEPAVWRRQPKQRSLPQHRMFWAWAQTVADNTDGLDRQAAADLLKIIAGHVTTVGLPSGDVLRVPRSISFSAMSQDEANDFIAAVQRAAAMTLGIDLCA